MEVPRLGVKQERQLLATATATADPNRICDLHCSLCDAGSLPASSRIPVGFVTTESQWELLYLFLKKLRSHPEQSRGLDTGPVHGLWLQPGRVWLTASPSSPEAPEVQLGGLLGTVWSCGSDPLPAGTSPHMCEPGPGLSLAASATRGRSRGGRAFSWHGEPTSPAGAHTQLRGPPPPGAAQGNALLPNYSSFGAEKYNT